MARLKNIQTARKRAVSMGVPHPFSTAFEKHKLAACISNYSIVIEVEAKEPAPNFLDVLVYINIMAKAINDYCDAFMVRGDEAAEYWLSRFLLRCDTVGNLSKIN